MSKLYAVSGSASGIGRAVRTALEARGETVLGIDLKDAEIQADLSSLDGRSACGRALREAAPGGLDGFIPCAGVGGSMGLSRQVVEVNYFGAVELLEAAYPLLRKRGGVAVVIGSNSMATPGQDEALIELLLGGARDEAHQHVARTEVEPYPSAKTALCRWMRRHAVHWIQQGVRMNAIAPGITETAMIATQRQHAPWLNEALSDFAKSSPVGRAATPQEIADVILFLLSDQARFICGEVLFADAGHAAAFRPDHV